MQPEVHEVGNRHEFEDALQDEVSDRDDQPGALRGGDEHVGWYEAVLGVVQPDQGLGGGESLLLEVEYRLVVHLEVSFLNALGYDVRDVFQKAEVLVLDDFVRLEHHLPGLEVALEEAAELQQAVDVGEVLGVLQQAELGVQYGGVAVVREVPPHVDHLRVLLLHIHSALAEDDLDASRRIVV